MNLETLAQDLTDKRHNMLRQKIALSEANMALFDAGNTLSDALCEAYGSNHDDVVIALKNHAVLCKWNRYACEYTFTFISKVPNANT